MRRLRALPAILILLCWSGAAQAHKASTSYLRLDVRGAQLSGRWDIALRDLDDAVGLDADGNGALSWGEVRRAAPAIEAYALSRLQVAADGKPCSLAGDGLRIADHSDGRYAVLELRGRCAQAPHALQLGYNLLFDSDALHRGLLRLDFHGVQTGVFAPDKRALRFGAERSGLAAFGEYFRAGLFHVWSGLDHLLFLAGLFLPAVLRRQNGAWIAAPDLGAAARETAGMVTAFTVAHACTLSLAATGSLALPARAVECGVAATVLFAGVNNLLPMVHRGLLGVAGAFGLVHGAAIAGALIELGLPASGRVWALLAFNLGVEAAQLSVLLAVLPPAFFARHSAWYRRLVLLPGSATVSAAGLIWLLERGGGLQLGVPLP